MLSIMLTVMDLTIEVEQEIQMREVQMIPDMVEQLGCYHSVSVSQQFIKEGIVEKRYDKLGVDTDPDKEEIKNLGLGDDRQRHWRMVFEDNNGEVG